MSTKNIIVCRTWVLEISTTSIISFHKFANLWKEFSFEILGIFANLLGSETLVHYSKRLLKPSPISLLICIWINIDVPFVRNFNTIWMVQPSGLFIFDFFHCEIWLIAISVHKTQSFKHKCLNICNKKIFIFIKKINIIATQTIDFWFLHFKTILNIFTDI